MFQGMEPVSATYLTAGIWITITVSYSLLSLSRSLGARWSEILLQQ